jgi:signal transduction histidine kinase
LAQALEPVRDRLARAGKVLGWSTPTRRLRAALDGDLAERILAPLLENAERLARSRVDVVAEATGSTVVITLRDDGPGVRDDEAERIFEPGVRGSAANGSVGAGLGLALARRLAEAAGGSIAAVPADCGVFRIVLPAS